DRYVILDSYPERDSMVFAKDTHDFIGGSGANIALNLSRCFETDFYFGTGNDSSSEWILERLSLSSMNLSYVVENGSGAETIVMLDSHGERRIISLGGHALFRGVIDEKRYDAICIADSFKEVAVDTFRKASESLKVYVPGGCGLYFGVDTVIEVSCLSDFTILSEGEAQTIQDRISEITSNVIITRGSSETIWIDRYKKSNSFEVEGIAGEILDTTGAGDAFAAGFIETFTKTGDPVQSINRGHKKAAEAVSVIGPNLAEGRKDLR
ncbi:MAG: carbohydrate kinase family protein, partial [Kosmotogaceae bacterium]|nr:carbohydrate kinase family protein [Kosmotogaceae bacterium]